MSRDPRFEDFATRQELNHIERRLIQMAEDIADLQASEAARDAKDDAVIALVSQLQTTNAALQAEVNNLPPDNSAAIQALINDNNAYIGKLSALVTPAAPADPAPADLNPSTSDPAPEQAAS